MNETLHETESLCPVCLKKIPARYERIDGKAYMLKVCPEHGEFRVLFWNDADMYEKWLSQGVRAPATPSRPPEKLGCPRDCGLCAGHRSGTCTAILEITYRCNMRCNIRILHLRRSLRSFNSFATKIGASVVAGDASNNRA